MRFCERALKAILEVSMSGVILFLRNVAATDEGLRVERANAALCLDEAVHERLRHRRVVTLVVPAAAEADDIDDDVFVELLAESEREFCDAQHGLGVVAIHVEDRRLNGLRDIRR